MSQCVLCGEKLPHAGECPEIRRRSAGTGVATVNRSAFLDSNPPSSFRELFGPDLYESMKLLDASGYIRDLPVGSGGASGSGVTAFNITREIWGNAEVKNGETHLTFQEVKTVRMKVRNESIWKKIGKL